MKSKPLSLLRSLFISYLLTGLLLLLLSFLLYKMKLSKNQIHMGIYAIYVAACFAGGFLAGRQLKSRRFLWGALSGFLYFSILLLLSLFFRRGIQSGTTQIIMNLFLCTGGGCVGGMVS